MAQRVQTVGIELKDEVESYFSLIQAAPDQQPRERVELESWLQAEKVEYNSPELGSALTELVKEGKLAIYMGHEGTVLFGPTGF